MTQIFNGNRQLTQDLERSPGKSAATYAVLSAAIAPNLGDVALRAAIAASAVEAGVTLTLPAAWVNGDRLLIAPQATGEDAVDNGLWEWSDSRWIRPRDYAGEQPANTTIEVRWPGQAGDAATAYELRSDSAISVGTTATSWYEEEAAGAKPEDLADPDFSRAKSGLVLSAVAGANTFEVTAGTAIFNDNYTDPSQPVTSVLEFAGGSFPLPAVLSASAIAYVGLRPDGTFTESVVAPNVSNLGGVLWLGYVVSFDGGATVRNAGPALVGLSDLNVLALALGMINVTSTTVSPIAGTLQVSLPEMILYSPGRNWGDTPAQRMTPAIHPLPAVSPMVFNYMDSTGAITALNVDTFDFSRWDDDGAVGVVDGNNATSQRVYSSSDGTIVVLYGQQEYTSINQAIQRFTAEQVTRPAELSGFIFICSVIGRNDTTDIANENQARTIGGGKLGDGMGAGFTGNNLKPIGRGDTLPADALDHDLFILDASTDPANPDGFYYWDVSPGEWAIAVSKELEIKPPDAGILQYDRINLVGDGGTFAFPTPKDQALELVVQPGAANSFVSIGGTNYAIPEDNAGGTVPYQHIAFRFDPAIAPSGDWRSIQSEPPTSSYQRLTNGQTLQAGKMYVGTNQTVNTPLNPKDGDLFYIRNDADLLNVTPGDLPRITLNGPLRTPEGNNITSFTVAPGFEFTPTFTFSLGRWTADFQITQVITLQNINSGQELRGNTVYEIEATVANMFFKLPAIPAGAITIRLANGSAFPVTIQQYDTGGTQQLRFENNTIFPSFVIGTENTGQRTDLIGFPFANRWKVYRDWEIDNINNNALPWQANKAYVVDEIVSQNRLSDGTLVLLQRIADGTSGATYDATEEALWNEIGLAPVNIPILESLEITTQSYLSSWSQINNVVLSNKADEEIPSIEWVIVDDSDGTAPGGTPLEGIDISPQDVNSTRTIKLQYSGTIQRRGLGAIKVTHGHPGSTSRVISVVAKYFNGDTKIWSNTGLGVTGEITDQINEPDGFDFIARAELEPFTEENYGDLPLGTSDAVVDEYYFAVAPSGTNAETEGTTYLVQSKTTTIPNPLTALFWNDPNNLIVVGQGAEVVRIPRLIAVDKVVSTPDPIPSTEVSNSRILYIGNTTAQIYHYDASGAFAGTITDQPQVRWADGALLTDKDTGTEYKYIRGTNKFESLQLLGELPIVRYTADGAIQDIDHRAIFETGAVNMTLSASTIDRVMQMVSEDPITVITADGTEQFTGSLGTSTDSKLTLNETFKWATVIGRTAGGWSQYVGQVGISDGVDISTPTKFKSGTRFVQNGIVAAPSVTFPEAFKVGTIPTIKVLAQDIGDNVNVTLQTVTNTGFTSWVVRNESDVGIGAPIIHWEATGEVA